MIIWLASYPKSGNTWVRLFLNSLLYLNNEELNINDIKIEQFPNKKHFSSLVDDMGNINELVKNTLNAQSLLNLDNNIKLLKTHSALWKSDTYSFTNNENTLGVIYIVRDPRNVITSIKNHFNKVNYNEALDFIKHERKFIGLKNVKEENDVPTLISSWSTHYKSWKKIKSNYLLIKYENLLNKTNSEFLKITDFLKKNTSFQFNDENIKKAIRDCDFEKLKKQESEKGFVESSIEKSQKFFFLGPKNNWQKILDSEIQNEIETYFESEMKELGYL